MNHPHKFKDVIVAWANGEEIEFRDPNYSTEWKPIKNPIWLADIEYRVKPKEEIHSFRVALLMIAPNEYFTITADDAEQEDTLQHDPLFIGWLGGWQSFKLETKN